jgi:3-hydroxybutyryl-CoA dehydrogenase
MKKIKRVGVLGCGLMGSGIAQVSAQAGYDTVVVEVEQKFLDKGLAGIDKSLGKFVEKGKLSTADKSACLARLRGSVSLKELAECDFVVEAITENPQIKKETYAAIDTIVKQDAIFASNTSSLTITELSMATARPKQFVGLHFFNPVPLMKLVEVVRTILTSDETYETAFEFAKSLGKEPVSCRDNSGFIVNRLLIPYLLDAVRAYEEGIGSIEDIDKAMQLGCGYPMGPFTLIDFVGLDTTYYITDVMFNEYREKRFASPALLRKMVLAGRFGRKSGSGFYDYSGEKPVAFDRMK